MAYVMWKVCIRSALKRHRSKTLFHVEVRIVYLMASSRQDCGAPSSIPNSATNPTPHLVTLQHLNTGFSKHPTYSGLSHTDATREPDHKR